MVDYYWYASVNRFVCATLDEMRKSIKNIWNPVTRRHLSSLIEEAQSCVNRMEAGLADWNDIRSGRDTIRDMKIEFRELKRDIKKLRKEKEQLEKSNKADSTD